MEISQELIIFSSLFSFIIVIIINKIKTEIIKERKQYEDEVFKKHFNNIEINQISNIETNIIEETFFIIGNIYENGLVDRLIKIIKQDFQYKNHIIIEKESPTSIKINYIKPINMIEGKNFAIEIAKFLTDIELYSENYFTN
jgi:hypothetical protein